MNRSYKITLTLLSLILLVALACTDRGTNAPDTTMESQVTPWGLWPEVDHVFVEDPTDPYPSTPRQLHFQIRNTDAIQDMEILIPEQAILEGKRVPLLVLLAPMWGDHHFYTEHGLLELAQEMITTGEIQPMVIACLGTDQLFGGYFWGNSFPAGFYDEIIAHPHQNALIGWINNQIPSLIDSPGKRGIGGVGIGAYGAYRAILKNTGQYSSISVADGPLDFDGADGSSGLINLFDDVLSEQGLAAADFNLMDSSHAWPITSMMISGSLAFSPHDTAVSYRDSILAGNRGVMTIISGTSVITDSTTLVEGIVNSDMGNWDFHLPFDQTLLPYAPIWSLWMDHDLESLLADGGYTSLNNVNMWIATSPDANYGFYDMTQSWIATLHAHDYTPEIHNYGGYNGLPATEHEYVYDLLREMLIFHSENFGD